MTPSNPIVGHIDQKLSEFHPLARAALQRAFSPPIGSVPGGVQTLPGLPQQAAPLADPVGGVSNALPPNSPTGEQPPEPRPLAKAGSMASPLPPSYEAPSIPPEQAKLTDLRNSPSGIGGIKSPWARIPLQIADAIGGGLFPGIEQRIPGTQGHHDVLVRQQERAQAGESEEQNASIKRALEEAQMRHTEAQTHELENPTPPPEPADQYSPLPGESGYGAFNKRTGQVTPVMTGDKPFKPIEKSVAQPKSDIHALYADAVEDSFHRGVDPQQDPKVQQLAQSITALQKQPVEKEPARDDKAIAIYAKDPAQRTPEEQTYLKGYEQYIAKTKVEPGVARANIFVNNRAVQTLDENGRVVYSRAGDAMREKLSAAANIPASMRDTRAFAQTVTDQVPALHQEIDQLKDKIGPGAGRWTSLWVNKAGMDDPEFAGLDQDLKLYASAIVRVHFGKSGGQKLREALEKNFSTAQSPEDLKQRVEHADQWVKGYATMGGAKSPQGGGEHSGAGLSHFSEGGESWDIPADKVAAFRAKHPNAKAQ